MKVRFISFAAGEHRYKDSLKRISEQAKLFLNNNVFNEIKIYTENDLKNLDNDWWIKNSPFLFNNKRGFGYWIWKPLVILKNLEELEDGDILIYCDSGCELNIKGIERMKEYIKITNEIGNLKFSLQDIHLEKIWCKKDLIDFIQNQFNINNHNLNTILNSAQCMATSQFYKKNNINISMLTHYSNICQIHHLIDDSRSLNKNDISFIEHRHDQSVNSILSKIYNQHIIKDETWPPEMVNDKSIYPIHALRNYSLESKLNFN